MKNTQNNHIAVISSTLLTGGSQAVAAMMTFVRTKVAAVYIGPEGIGIIGLLSQFQNVLTTGLDLGVSNSAVREISVLRSRGGEGELAGLVKSLFRLARYATVGCLLIGVCLCEPLARWMFNKQGYAQDVALASLGAALMLLAGAHSTLQRGHGLVAGLAVQRIVVALGSAIAAYLGYRWFGISAVPFVLVVSGGLTWLVARFQSAGLRPYSNSVGEQVSKVSTLIRHGIPFLWAALLFAIVSYLVGVMVVDYCGLKMSGIYQAAWGFTGYLVGFVLTAMGQDFLPRISAVIDSREEAVAMINSQMEAGVLLSLPGMFLFSAYADKSLSIFLSEDFKQAVPVAQCIMVGCLGRVLNWPMLFTLNAQRESRLHMIAVTAASIAYLLFAWIGLAAYGVLGAAWGFTLMQALHFMWLRVVLFRTIGMRFSANVVVAASIAVISLLAAPFLGPYQAALVFMVLGAFSLWRLAIATGKAPAICQKISDMF